MRYPKIQAAIDDAIASLVRKYGEQVAETYVMNMLTPLETVEEKTVPVPVSKGEEAKQ